MHLETQDKSKIGKSIREFFNHFFNENPSQQSTLTIPHKKLFLDFPNNTVHVWDRNPFVAELMDSGDERISDYDFLLSKKCLEIADTAMDGPSIFQFYIEMLFVILNYVDESKIWLSDVMDEICDRGSGDMGILNSFIHKAEELFAQNKNSVERYFKAIQQELKTNSSVLWISDWMRIVDFKLNSCGSKGTTDARQKLKELVFDASQKIDLNPKDLTQALVISQKLV